MKKTIELKIVNPNACGIDIGSKSHFVAVGQDKDDVKEFGISHSEHLRLIDFLKEREGKSIAMESTGSYWQSLYLILIENGFEVLLVPGSQTKGFRKTDVKDARHLQQMHALGLLTSCFLPDEFTEKLRELSRHRKSLIKESSKYTNKIQKCLRLMNIRLDVVISDITGVSGRRIINAIINGERNAEVLSQYCDSRIKKSKEEIADSIVGNFKDELMYELKDCYEIYELLQSKIHNVDYKIEEILCEQTKDQPNVEKTELAKKQIKGKNQPNIKIQEYCYKLYQVDLSAIQGVSTNTLLSIMSELGTNISKFRDAKSFASWLRLAPNNKISGGKVLSSYTPKGANPLTLALRDCANVIGNQKKGPLTDFFKKIGFKKGRCAAITATARKLAVIIFNMISKKEPYNPATPEYIIQKKNQNKLRTIKRLAIEQGFSIIDNQGVIIS